MSTFQIIALLLTLTALFSYVNYRWLGLPPTIGVMFIALMISLGLIGVTALGMDLREPAEHVLGRIDFDEALLQGMLSFLLFAGALQVNLCELFEQKWSVLSLAVGSVLISTLVYASGVYFIFKWLGLELNFLWCLLFGALISPTDPIAVMGILKSARVPKRLEVLISGESLFNDGVGVVLFLTFYGIVQGEQGTSVRDLSWMLLQEGAGGALIGLGLGWVTYLLLKSIDQYQVEILLTLALVTGGYALAMALHTSGPIAIVTAGLVIGNHGRKFAMSQTTREHVDTFWELIDGILNAVLFVLIGLEVLLLKFSRDVFLAGLASIVMLLLARWISVALPALAVRLRRPLQPGVITILTWGALRGGISVAMALSLPGPSHERDVIVSVTYILVVFGIVVQGLTIGRLIRHWYPLEEASASK